MTHLDWTCNSSIVSKLAGICIVVWNTYPKEFLQFICLFFSSSSSPQTSQREISTKHSVYSDLYQVGMLPNSPLDIHLDILRSLKKADSPLLPNIQVGGLKRTMHIFTWMQTKLLLWFTSLLSSGPVDIQRAHTRVVTLQTTQMEARERSHCTYDSNL